MPTSRFSPILYLGLLCALSVSNPFMSACQAEGGKTLRGRVGKDDSLGGKPGVDAGAPALSRTDIEKAGDPFKKAPAGDAGLAPLIDAPHDALNEAALLPQLPQAGKSTFGLSAEDEGFSGTPGSARPDTAGKGALQPISPAEDSSPLMAPGQMAGMSDPLKQAGGDAADPDNSREMQLLWEQWHKRIAETLYQRWLPYANSVFKNATPMQVGLVYTVTRDHHVKDIRIVRSPNVMLNSLAVQLVKTLDNDHALLEFPAGSRRMNVEKQAAFYVNTGAPANMMRYTTGDKETIRVR